LIRRGDEVRVLDHESGDDITAQIQAQIIFEQEKKLRGGVPRSVLTGLIQAGSDTLTHLRQALTSAAELRAQADADIQRRLQALAQQGTLDPAEARRLNDLLLGAADLPFDPDWPGEDEIRRVLEQRGTPSRADLKRLERQVEGLLETIEQLARAKRQPRQ
jgi:hypothetical protein